LREYGINAPKGEVAKSPEEAFDIAKKLGNTI
jgi:succinyl-CoA synthetase beta subunit